jgi:ubiquinone/menaquinone biosynthesis C-methylase UbiE
VTTNEELISANKASWDEVAHRFFGRTALPAYGPYAPRESTLDLFGDVSGAKVLDVGCGSGHSLMYMAARGVSELWGIDLSDTQIKTTSSFLESKTSAVTRLFQSPMEQDPGLPHDYFDVVYSINAIGWTVDLPKTLRNVFSYLKPGGSFIFSWEHPLHNRIQLVEKAFVVSKSYHEEGLYQSEAWNDRTAIMNQVKLSTYINELIKTGFQIEKVIEDVFIPDEAERGFLSRWYSVEKAELIPDTFIIKCFKPVK